MSTVHAAFDVLAYAGANAAFYVTSRKERSSEPWSTRLLLSLGAFGMGIVLSRVAVQLEGGIPGSWEAFCTGFASGGKTIVGAMLGGVLGVKLVKIWLRRSRGDGERLSFGDGMVLPITVGLVIARTGCLLAGMDDDTYGIATTLPWGWDYGDGIARHPTQIYEIVGILAVTGTIVSLWKRFTRPGDRFKWFLLGFFALRFFIELVRIHPDPYMGMSIYQVLCVIGAVWALLGRF